MKYRNKKEKPIACGIDMTCRNTANLPNPGGFRVKYKCPHCQNDMCYWLGDKELFCHNCGQKIDWGVIMYIDSKRSDELEDTHGTTRDALKQSILDQINKTNPVVGEHPVFIPEADGNNNAE